MNLEDRAATARTFADLARWIEEGRHLFGLLPLLLARLATAEQQCAQLQEELAELRRHNEELQHEWDDISEGLVKLVDRLRR